VRKGGRGVVFLIPLNETPAIKVKRTAAVPPKFLGGKRTRSGSRAPVKELESKGHMGGVRNSPNRGCSSSMIQRRKTPKGASSQTGIIGDFYPCSNHPMCAT